MTLVQERGLFWPKSTPVPAGNFAPDSSVAGTLTIDEAGFVSLELDGYFPDEKGPFSILSRQGKPHEDVYGVLRSSNGRTILSGVFVNGGQLKTNGISYQKFSANDCLVGSFDFPQDGFELEFAGLEIDLSGFEDWLWLRAIKVEQTDTRIAAEYEKPTAAIYLGYGETLTFDFDVGGKLFFHTGNDFSIKQMVRASFVLEQRAALGRLRERFGLFEDILILLTDSEYRPSWPFVAIDSNTKARWYFRRVRLQNAADPPQAHSCVATFPRVREVFGDIWTAWISKRDQFGPGFYLYLGTRRGIPLYPEHRFVNLIWGIEAFHRAKHPSDPDAASEQVNRIIGQVTEKQDKKLVRRYLRFAHEPTLSQRIFQIFSGLPIDLDEKRLREFAEGCAKARNDISHFGAHREKGSYSEFALGLEKKSAALSTLCHCLLLHEIGMSHEILTNWLYEAPTSFRIKHEFIEVGLLDKGDLKRPALSGGTKASPPPDK